MIALLGAFEFRLFAKRWWRIEGERIITAQKSLRCFFLEEDNDSGTSEGEEDELEHHLQVFSEKSR